MCESCWQSPYKCSHPISTARELKFYGLQWSVVIGPSPQQVALQLHINALWKRWTSTANKCTCEIKWRCVVRKCKGKLQNTWDDMYVCYFALKKLASRLHLKNVLGLKSSQANRLAPAANQANVD